MANLVDYSLAFAVCREGGHWWEYRGWNPESQTVQRQCVRGCKAWRYENYDQATMKKTRTRYKYPAGYLVKSITRVDAAVDCRRLIERLIKSRGLRFVRRGNRELVDLKT